MVMIAYPFYTMGASAIVAAIGRLFAATGEQSMLIVSFRTHHRGLAHAPRYHWSRRFHSDARLPVSRFLVDAVWGTGEG